MCPTGLGMGRGAVIAEEGPVRYAWLTACGLLFAAGGALAFEQADVDRLLSTSKCEKCDLKGADLSGADLSRAKLKDADLKAAKLANTDLRKADLRRATLEKADLSPQQCAAGS